MPMSSDEINVAYIAGYGRSGSTLLERILSTHPQVVGVGEIAYLADKRYADFYWGVAEGIPLWDQVEPELRFDEQELAKRQQIQKRHESTWTGWIYQFFKKPSEEYCQHTTQVLRAIDEALPTEANWIIDSSKTARDRFFRPFMFRKLDGVNACMIHVVRDPRGSVQSVRRGSNAAMERGQPRHFKFALLRSLFGWSMANLSGILFRALYGSENYVRIRYEELAADPVTCLKRLEPLLGVDFKPTAALIQAAKPLPAGSQFAGNRMRLETVIKLKTDERWRDDMPKVMQWLVAIVCSPILMFLRRQPKPPDDLPEYKSAA
ncbi:MAG: sulfotransferase [Planctomycetaceae bacterium]